MPAQLPPNFRPRIPKILRQCNDLLFPPICGICQHHPESSPGSFLCQACRMHLPFVQEPMCHKCGLPFLGHLSSSFQCDNCAPLTPHFDCARSCLLATPESLHLIHQLKYHSQTWLINAFVDVMMDVCVKFLFSPSFEPYWDYIVPIPLGPTRLASRGFSQTHDLGALLSMRANIPILQKALKRPVQEFSQAHLGRKKQILNVKGAFEAGVECSLVLNKNILLVDDVMTTGATASESAKILKKQGARSVGVITVVRGTMD